MLDFLARDCWTVSTRAGVRGLPEAWPAFLRVADGGASFALEIAHCLGDSQARTDECAPYVRLHFGLEQVTPALQPIQALRPA